MIGNREQSRLRRGRTPKECDPDFSSIRNHCTVTEKTVLAVVVAVVVSVAVTLKV